LRHCAANNVTMAESALDMTVMHLTIDGQPIDDLSAYRAATPLFTLWLPKGNDLGTDKPVADAVADGYQVMLSPLPAGDHVVVIAIPGLQPGEPAISITYNLHVVSGAYGTSPGASPTP
jgi:hypothetical protein